MSKQNINNPTVSVIIPNYNHAQFLTRRIESVLTQTYTDYEIIILDDCSTDNSRDIIEKYRDNPKVSKIVFNETNSGSTFPQWNKGVSLAAGKYIWFAESDDFAQPNFLEQMVAILDKYPSVVLAKCQSEIIDQDNNILYNYEDRFPHFRCPGKPLTGINDCFSQIRDSSGIVNASAVLFRKDAFLQAGGAPENFKISGDWMTWARMLGHGDIYYHPEPLNQMRQLHVNSARAAHMTGNQCRNIIENLSITNFITSQYKAPISIKIAALNHQISQWSKIALNLKDKCISPLDNIKILAHAMKISPLALPLTLYHFPARTVSVILSKIKVF